MACLNAVNSFANNYLRRVFRRMVLCTLPSINIRTPVVFPQNVIVGTDGYFPLLCISDIVQGKIS